MKSERSCLYSFLNLFSVMLAGFRKRFIPKSALNHGAFEAFLADLEALGVRRVTEGGRRYGIISTRSNARWWLLPIDSTRAASAGLEMLQPVTTVATLGRVAIRELLRFGLHPLIGSRHLRLSRMPDLCGAFDGQAEHIACFTGTDGPHRKTTLQVMGADGRILGYAKTSRASHVRPYIRNEAEMLGRLARLDLSTADVPAVTAFRDDDELTLLVTDSLKSASYAVPLVPGAEHLAFLAELRAHTQKPGAKSTLDSLSKKAATLVEVAGPEWNSRLARVDAALRPQSNSIPVCLGHGDFTPWNSFLQRGRLYVFDWEYADTNLPVGFDLAHFYLATIPPTEQPDSLDALTRALAREYFDGDTEPAARALLLSLACHAVFYLGRLHEGKSSLPLWTGGPARAEMIDRMLIQRSEP